MCIRDSFEPDIYIVTHYSFTTEGAALDDDKMFLQYRWMTEYDSCMKKSINVNIYNYGVNYDVIWIK